MRYGFVDFGEYAMEQEKKVIRRIIEKICKQLIICSLLLLFIPFFFRWIPGWDFSWTCLLLGLVVIYIFLWAGTFFLKLRLFPEKVQTQNLNPELIYLMSKKISILFSCCWISFPLTWGAEHLRLETLATILAFLPLATCLLGLYMLPQTFYLLYCFIRYPQERKLSGKSLFYSFIFFPTGLIAFMWLPYTVVFWGGIFIISFNYLLNN